MRSAGNFNPEWGYLAPAPSLMRTLRVVLVATAVGATAGAAVVISLVDRPANSGDKTASAAAHAIVTSVQAAPAPSAAALPSAVTSSAAPVKLAAPEPAPVSAPAAAPQVVPPTAVAVAPQQAPPSVAASSTPVGPIAPPHDSPHAATLQNPAGDIGAAAVKPTNGVAALSYASPSVDDEHAGDERAADRPDESLLRPESAEKKARHHVGSAYASNGKDKLTPNLGSFLRRIFHPHPAGTSYYNR